MLRQFLFSSIYKIQFQMPEKKRSKSSKSQRKNKIQKATTVKQQIKAVVPSCPVNGLNNIIELTQQYETNRFNTESIEEASAFLKKNTKAWWQRSFDCVKRAFQCFQTSKQFSIEVKEEEIIKTIEKLRNESLKLKPFLPPLESGKKTLVLDIDQTLVYSSQLQFDNYDFSFLMPFKKTQIKVYSKNRFGLESFLFQMSKIYELVIYTTNIKEYVDNVLENIDKKKRISHILYKDKCLNLNKVHYLKSLKALGRDPEKVVFIDHNIASGILQPKNFLGLKSFIGEKHDRELVKLIPFLRDLAQKKSVLPVCQNYDQYFNREIQLKFSCIQEQGDESENKQNSFEQKQKRRNSDTSTGKRRKKHHRREGSQHPLRKAQESENEDGAKCDIKQTQETECSLRARNPNIQVQM